MFLCFIGVMQLGSKIIEMNGKSIQLGLDNLFNCACIIL